MDFIAKWCELNGIKDDGTSAQVDASQGNVSPELQTSLNKMASELVSDMMNKFKQEMADATSKIKDEAIFNAIPDAEDKEEQEEITPETTE